MKFVVPISCRCRMKTHVEPRCQCLALVNQKFLPLSLAKTVEVTVKDLGANCVDLDALGEEPQGKRPKQLKYDVCIGKEVEISTF